MSTIHITFVKLKNVTSPVQLLVQLYADTWLRTPYTVMQFNITIHPPNKITSWMNLGKVKSDKYHQESQWLNIASCLCSMRLHYTEHILLSSCQCWNFILSMEELFHFTSGPYSSLLLGLPLSSLVRRRHCFLLRNCWSISSSADCFPSLCLLIGGNEAAEQGMATAMQWFYLHPSYHLFLFTQVQTTCDRCIDMRKTASPEGDNLSSLVKSVWVAARQCCWQYLIWCLMAWQS